MVRPIKNKKEITNMIEKHKKEKMNFNDKFMKRMH